MASEGKCQDCGQVEMILPSLATGDKCDACGGQLQPTGQPMTFVGRWDQTRHLPPEQREWAEKHQRWVQHELETKADKFKDGTLEIVPLETRRRR